MRDVPNTPLRRGHPAGTMSSKAFYGLLGSSPVLLVGPESASALLVGASVATLGGIRAHIRVLVMLPMEQPEQLPLLDAERPVVVVVHQCERTARA